MNDKTCLILEKIKNKKDLLDDNYITVDNSQIDIYKFIDNSDCKL